jgi:hypothetical protein
VHVCLYRADKEVMGLFDSQQQQQQQAGAGPAAATAAAAAGGEAGGDLWRQLLRALGPQHAAMARIPEAAWCDLQQLRI